MNQMLAKKEEVRQDTPPMPRRWKITHESGKRNTKPQ